MKNVYKFLILLIILCLTACRETIVHDVTENEANKLLSGLHAAGFNVHKEKLADGKWSLQVDKSESMQAIRYLESRRLLTNTERNTLTSGGILRDREESRFRFERSLSGELEHTLAAIEGVLDVRVHLNLPERDPLLGRKVNSANTGSGSVLLIVQENYQIDAEQIKDLVAGAGGITKESINVLISRTTLADPLSTSRSVVAKAEITAATISAVTTVTNNSSGLIDYLGNLVKLSATYNFWLSSFISGSILLVLFLYGIKKRKLNKLARILQN